MVAVGPSAWKYAGSGSSGTISLLHIQLHCPRQGQLDSPPRRRTHKAGISPPSASMSPGTSADPHRRAEPWPRLHPSPSLVQQRGCGVMASPSALDPSKCPVPVRPPSSHVNCPPSVPRSWKTHLPASPHRSAPHLVGAVCFATAPLRLPLPKSAAQPAAFPAPPSSPPAARADGVHVPAVACRSHAPRRSSSLSWGPRLRVGRRAHRGWGQQHPKAPRTCS
mmetsp:Transcript_88591/g.229890  ORF Transcript_88591/g.229890 Transcript_88591/m.229890 type:complete len:222 (-) Transcript_88591:1060-1725(-)